MAICDRFNPWRTTVATLPQTFVTTPMSQRSARGRRRFGDLIPVARRVLAWVRRCVERAAERRTLAQMTEWQLRDIGVSRGEAKAEAAKPCWRA
jgi:uncharacterized protein YjiS (DUF1127 family)